MKKRVCIVTGTRAEWGLFYPLAREIKRHKKDFVLKVIATGSHLSSKYGSTYREIERDGFKIDCKVPMLSKIDTEASIAISVSRGIKGMADAFKGLKIDMVFLLGDRFETFAAASAATFLKVPIVHMHGGELTQGSMDDTLRHAITKMSSIHFASTKAYRERIIQMGEDPRTVFNVGALGLDNIKKTKLLKRAQVEKKIRFKLGNERNVMVTYLPPTAQSKASSISELKNLFNALDTIKDARIIFTKPSADIYSDSISKMIDTYVSKNRTRAAAFKSLGRVLYLSALQYMDVVAGNSSSGIIEVPSFKIPTINIGKREQGRIKGDTVINIEDGKRQSITEAFKTALSRRFKDRCRSTKNEYGDGKASKRIVDIVKRVNNISSEKRFFDLDCTSLKKRKEKRR